MMKIQQENEIENLIHVVVLGHFLGKFEIFLFPLSAFFGAQGIVIAFGRETHRFD